MNCNSCNSNNTQGGSMQMRNQQMARNTRYARTGNMNHAHQMNCMNHMNHANQTNHMNHHNHGINNRMAENMACRDDERHIHTECGCEENRESREKRECGCVETRETRDCGCVVNRETRDNRECGCEDERQSRIYIADSCNQATCPVDTMEIAMGYVPWQQWGKLYDYEEALCRGTIFVDLDKPWIGRCCN